MSSLQGGQNETITDPILEQLACEICPEPLLTEPSPPDDLKYSRKYRLLCNYVLPFVAVIAFFYNLLFRIVLMTGYLSSCAALITGIFAVIGWYQNSRKKLILNRDLKPKTGGSKDGVYLDNSMTATLNFFQRAYKVKDKTRLALNVFASLVVFVNFCCYLLIGASVVGGIDEYLGAMFWYFAGFLVSLVLIYQQVDLEEPISPSPGKSVYTQASGIAKWFLVGIFYTLFVFTLFDSCFRAHAYGIYYAKADMHRVMDSNLQFDCFCGGDGEQRPFKTCLDMHRKRYSEDRVLVFEHGLGSNSYTQRKLVRYLSRNVTSYIFCAYNRRMHGFSDRLSWSDLQRFLTVDESVRYLATWIVNQNLNSPIIYAGHSYGSFHLVHMAKYYPSLVKSLVIVDGSWINGKVYRTGGDWAVPQHLPNINGLLTGLPLTIVGSMDYQTFLKVIGQEENDNLAFDPQDGPELIASLIPLNFYEVMLRDYYLGFVNSEIITMYTLNTGLEMNQTISIPTLFLYVNYGSINDSLEMKRMAETEITNPAFFDSKNFYPIYNTTHTGILSRKWKESGDAIASFIRDNHGPS